MATYNNTIDIDYDAAGDTVKTGTEKIVEQLDAVYVILNTIDAAYKAADAGVESDYLAADAVLAAADAALGAAYIAADVVVAEFINKILIVSDTKASGTEGGVVAAGWAYRTINTVEHNGITGASLASDTITLPVGTYLVEGRVPGCACKGHKAALQLQGDPLTDLVIGSPERAPDADLDIDKHSTWSKITGKFTISAGQTTLKVRHYTEGHDQSADWGAGRAFSAAGLAEVYTWLKFQKIA